jgi:hypothetical protein
LGAEDDGEDVSRFGLVGRDEAVEGLDVVTPTPNLAKTCASSTPTAPPPRTSSELESSLVSTASRLV